MIPLSDGIQAIAAGYAQARDLVITPGVARAHRDGMYLPAGVADVHDHPIIGSGRS